MTHSFPTRRSSDLADQCVVVIVTRTVQSGTPEQCQVLERAAEGVVNAGLDGIVAFSSDLQHLIADIVDDVGVVAVTTTQLIRDGSAIKTVAGRVAHTDLIPSIAGALIGSGSFNTDQLLDVFREDRASTHLTTRH